MEQDIRAINEKVKKESVFVEELIQEIGKVIVGQRYVIERMLIGLLSNGHILLEGRHPRATAPELSAHRELLRRPAVVEVGKLGGPGGPGKLAGRSRAAQ